MLTIILLILIIVLLGSIYYQLYYSFFIPELNRRSAFDKLTAAEVEELRNTMTADHFFRIAASSQLPMLKAAKLLTKNK